MSRRFLTRMPGLMLMTVIMGACAATSMVTPTVPAPEVPDTPAGRPFVLGDISDDPGEVIEGSQPLADYIAERLSEYGIGEGQVKVAASADEMAQMLANGEVDLYFDSVYPATLIADASGATPILRRWRYGVEEYRSLIFASKDSGIETLEDLPGNMIAFDNPFSTSGYVLPAVYLTEAGISLTGKQSYNDSVADDEVGYVFSYDDDNTLQWVLSGFAAAGATDNVSYDLFFPDEAKERLVILAESEDVPRQVVVARPNMDEDLLAAVIAILTSIQDDASAEEALDAFQTTRFDTFPEGIETTLERMRELRDIVADIDRP